MKNILEISKIIKNIKTDTEINSFFKELLTESEIETLSKRWQILQMIRDGYSQREIAKDLKVSLCKVTRGAKIMKNRDSILAKNLKKEIK